MLMRGGRKSNESLEKNYEYSLLNKTDLLNYSSMASSKESSRSWELFWLLRIQEYIILGRYGNYIA